MNSLIGFSGSLRSVYWLVNHIVPLVYVVHIDQVVSFVYVVDDCWKKLYYYIQNTLYKTACVVLIIGNISNK
jgi:hypothetical protein